MSNNNKNNEKIIKLSEEDFNYFIKLTDALKDFEIRIAALEITKMRLYKEYEILNDQLTQFSKQIKIKYNIPTDNAIIDSDTKSIIYTLEEKDNNK